MRKILTSVCVCVCVTCRQVSFAAVNCCDKVIVHSGCLSPVPIPTARDDIFVKGQVSLILEQSHCWQRLKTQGKDK